MLSSSILSVDSENQMKLAPWEPDLKSLVDRIRDGDIDLQPDFQRQEVWPIAKKKKLVDTIARNWSIPPIHLIVRDNNYLDVLDGQQRLAAIRDFFNDIIPIDGNITPDDSRIRSLHGLYYSQLSIGDRRQFDQYTLRGYRITDYAPEEPSELFYRLNQPTGLTAGEKRNALYGIARDQIKTLMREFSASGGGKETIGFSNSRMAYEDVFARLAFFLENGNILEKATESSISEYFRSKTGFSNRTINSAARSIKVFSRQVGHINYVRLNKASLLSWLLLFSRQDSHLLDSGYFQKFYNQFDPSIGLSIPMAGAYELFHDRASLRVTDVSSVLYRDFCLCFIYYVINGKRIEIGVDTRALSRASEIADSHTDLPFEGIVELALTDSPWGAL